MASFRRPGRGTGDLGGGERAARRLDHRPEPDAVAEQARGRVHLRAALGLGEHDAVDADAAQRAQVRRAPGRVEPVDLHEALLSREPPAASAATSRARAASLSTGATEFSRSKRSTSTAKRCAFAYELGSVPSR